MSDILSRTTSALHLHLSRGGGGTSLFRSLIRSFACSNDAYLHKVSGIFRLLGTNVMVSEIFS